MIVQSGNDACIALAEAVAGSEEVFAQMMNREAQRLGMKDTNFANSTGLSAPTITPAPTTCAARGGSHPRLSRVLPLLLDQGIRYNNITQPNRNRLLRSTPTSTA